MLSIACPEHSRRVEAFLDFSSAASPSVRIERDDLLLPSVEPQLGRGSFGNHWLVRFQPVIAGAERIVIGQLARVVERAKRCLSRHLVSLLTEFVEYTDNIDSYWANLFLARCSKAVYFPLVQYGNEAETRNDSDNETVEEKRRLDRLEGWAVVYLESELILHTKEGSSPAARNVTRSSWSSRTTETVQT